MCGFMKMLDYTVLSIFPTHPHLGEFRGTLRVFRSAPLAHLLPPTSACKRQQPCQTGVGLRKFLRLHADGGEGEYTAGARSNDVSNLQVCSRRLRIHSEHSGRYSLLNSCPEWVDLSLLFNCFQPECLSLTGPLYGAMTAQKK